MLTMSVTAKRNRSSLFSSARARRYHRGIAERGGHRTAPAATPPPMLMGPFQQGCGHESDCLRAQARYKLDFIIRNHTPSEGYKKSPPSSLQLEEASGAAPPTMARTTATREPAPSLVFAPHGTSRRTLSTSPGLIRGIHERGPPYPTRIRRRCLAVAVQPSLVPCFTAPRGMSRWMPSVPARLHYAMRLNNRKPAPLCEPRTREVLFAEASAPRHHLTGTRRRFEACWSGPVHVP